MQVNVYTLEGKVSKTLEVPENIFGAKWNADLVSQVLYSQASNRRAGTAHTKDRGEVAGGNKKPWQQKGTGRARHGSIRSPLWRHGGITHGPRVEKSYKKTITKSMKVGALFSLLSAKYKLGKIIFVDALPSNIGKTKDADTLMKGLQAVEGFKTLTYKKPNNVYMALGKGDATIKRAFRNLPYMTLHTVEDLNPLDIANSRYLVISDPEESIKYLTAKTVTKVNAKTKSQTKRATVKNK